MGQYRTNSDSPCRPSKYSIFSRYLWAGLFPVTTKIPIIYGKQNDPARRGAGKDVLLVLDKQQGKVSAVKGIDKDGNLQTVPPTTGHGGEFMQVDKNSDVFSNFISNFYRKYQDTSGLELFSVKASEAERDAKAIEDNHRNPTPEGDKRAEMLRVPKPDFHEFKQGYRFDPSKIDWENLKKSASPPTP